MMESVGLAPDTKRCPICSQLLHLAEFGICRARKDGHNLYCKTCIRRKVSESRRAQKSYKSMREQYVLPQVLPCEADAAVDLPATREDARQIIRMTPAERVREAIRKGARTQKQIAQRTKLGKDEIGDALANLLLWTYEIRTEVISNMRMYFINEPVPESSIAQTEQSLAIPQRKRDVPCSFSSLQLLMPGKNRDETPEKISGWVAA